MSSTLIQKLLKSSLIVSLGTLLSRVLGLVRDVVIAMMLGASNTTDAFWVAQKIPNFFRRLFAEGAFSQAFIPVLATYYQAVYQINTGLPQSEIIKNKQAFQALRQMIDAVASALTLVLLIITGLAVLGADGVALLFAAGYADEPAQFELVSQLIQITFPYLAFISLVAFSGSILNIFERFAVPALTPIWLNICLISAAIWWVPTFNEPSYALAWAVFIAGIVQLLFQLPFLWQLDVLPRPSLQFNHPAVKRILTLMAPALLGVAAVQINLLIDTVLATFLQTGSVSWLYYSDRLLELPVALIGVAMGTVLLPQLSKLAKRLDWSGFKTQLRHGISVVFIVGLPASVGLAILSAPILATLFAYGAFTAADLIQTKASLLAYSLALLPMLVMKQLQPAFYAREDIRTPVRVSIEAVCVNILFNLLLFKPFAHVGLALATAIAAIWQCGRLLYILKQQSFIAMNKTGYLIALKAFIAVLVMIVPLLIWLPGVDIWLKATVFERVIWLFGWVAGSVTLYVATLWLLKYRLIVIAKPGDSGD